MDKKGPLLSSLGYLIARREITAPLNVNFSRLSLQYNNLGITLLHNKVILRTDHHSLKWLNSFRRPEGMLARWLETLSEFDYSIVHRPGRLRCNADGASRPLCKQC